VLPSGQKLTLGLLATITLEVVPFRAYVPFPALLSFFKFILEVLLFKGAQHCLRFCLNHLNYIKMVAFQFYLRSGNQGTVEWGGGYIHVVFGQQFPGEKGSIIYFRR
jgi:hypothetical protein